MGMVREARGARWRRQVSAPYRDTSIPLATGQDLSLLSFNVTGSWNRMRVQRMDSDCDSRVNSPVGGRFALTG
jgi:hypothetical protein